MNLVSETLKNSPNRNSDGQQFVAKLDHKVVVGKKYSCFGDERLPKQSMGTFLMSEPGYQAIYNTIRQVISGAAYLHRNGIAHRSIDLHAVQMVTDPSNGLYPKISQYHAAAKLEYVSNGVVKPMQTIFNVFGELPPEAYVQNPLNSQYEPMALIDLRKADTWSIGLLLFNAAYNTNFSNYIRRFKDAQKNIAMFKAMKQSDLDEMLGYDAKTGKLTPNEKGDKTVYPPVEIVEMLRTLLNPDPKFRPTPEEYLQKYPKGVKVSLGVTGWFKNLSIK
ncbi:hypothetical protein BDF19DRAFT_447539 [Syncephalis fuscata]|nr:hypothetical protein BDF19DRAFT_447539 [Syncephalis fuscata]